MMFSRYCAALRRSTRDFSCVRNTCIVVINNSELLSAVSRKCTQTGKYSTFGKECNGVTELVPNLEDRLAGITVPTKAEVPITYNPVSKDETPLEISGFENSDYLPDFVDKRPGALDTCVDDLSHIRPSFPMTFNFAAYANDSPMIQKLAELGVDFSKLEKRKGIAKFLMPLDFERDMKMHITFLTDCGIAPNELGEFLTKNPLIFKEDLDDLHVRIRYLRAHKFTPTMITRIVSQNPYWVMFSTKRIDSRLGYFQKEFQLSGDEVRGLVTKQPRLITYRMAAVQENTFSVREEMGFNKSETKMILLNKPRIWMRDRKQLVECFDYAHNEMQLSHEIIAQKPGILTCRLNKLKERHMFLVTQGRAQYDPQKPLYVSLHSLISNSDANFSIDVAKAPVETFNLFLKSL